MYDKLIMARLFAVVAPTPLTISFSLTSQPGVQSRAQGWGVGWYSQQHKAIVQKGMRSVINQSTNEPVRISANTTVFLSHVRFASSGSVSAQNAHPFEFHDYLFAHSGTVNKELIESKLTPPFNENYQSEPIDSEVFFRFIIQMIKQAGVPDGMKKAIREAGDPNGINFLMTDGSTLYAYCRGLPLYYVRRNMSTPFHAFSQETGASFDSDTMASSPCIIVSSEKLTDDNWIAFDDHELFTAHTNLAYDSTKML